MDKKLVISIIFIVLIISSGLVFVFINDSSDDEPNIIEDDELTKSDVAHNINEKIESIDSYNINKDISLRSNTTRQVNSQRMYHNNLQDSYFKTIIQTDTEATEIEKYNFQNTEYTSFEESSEWNVRSDKEQDSIFNYIQIINENNINQYDMTHNEDSGEYIFDATGKELETISLLNNLFSENKNEILESNLEFTSASNTEYTFVIDDDTYDLKSLNINSEVQSNNEYYNVDIELSNVNINVDAITLPEELSSSENIYTDTYYSFLDISQVTDGGIQIEIKEDVSDIVDNIEIQTKENTFSINGQEGETITLSENSDYNVQSPNIQVVANMINGNIRTVGEYRISDTIETENTETEEEN